MERFLDIIKKYDCEIINGRILAKNGADTRIVLDSFLSLNEKLKSIKASNENEVKQEILEMFEQELKMRNEVLTHG